MRRSIVMMFVVCVFCLAVMQVKGAEPSAKEKAMLDNLLTATMKNDYNAFLKDASAQVKAGITKQMLSGVSAQVAPRMKKGYSKTYLGDLNQAGCRVYLYRLRYKDGKDDTLAKLVIMNGEVAGFLLQ